jgi:hypothetical protein
MKWGVIEENGGTGDAAPTPNELRKGQEEGNLVILLFYINIHDSGKKSRNHHRFTIKDYFSASK